MTESPELKEALEIASHADDPINYDPVGLGAAATLAEAYLREKEAREQAEKSCKYGHLQRDAEERAKQANTELKTMANKYTELEVALKEANKQNLDLEAKWLMTQDEVTSLEAQREIDLAQTKKVMLELMDKVEPLASKILKQNIEISRLKEAKEDIYKSEAYIAQTRKYEQYAEYYANALLEISRLEGLLRERGHE